MSPGFKNGKFDEGHNRIIIVNHKPNFLIYAARGFF
jgi:hypothetical protein